MGYTAGTVLWGGGEENFILFYIYVKLHKMQSIVGKGVMLNVLEDSKNLNQIIYVVIINY